MKTSAGSELARARGLAATARAFIAGKRSRDTRRAYRGDLVALGAFLLGVAGDDVEQLDADAAIARAATATRADVVAWRDAMIQAGRAPATIARRLSSTRTVFGALRSDGAILVNPAVGVEAPRVVVEDQRAPFLEVSDVRKLLAAATSGRHAPRARRNRAIVELLAGAGLRRGELCGLEARDVNVAARAILVRRGKGGKVRTLTVSAELAADLGELVAERPAESRVFPINGARVFALVRRWAQLAGLDPAQVQPHGLRRTYATVALDRGESLEQVRRAMGHADPRMTARYDRRRSSTVFVDYGGAHGEPRRLDGN